MSEKNKSDVSKGEDAVDEQEVDNLSQTEKAAFEKIMAEISVAEDNPDEKPTEPASDEKPLQPAADTTPTDAGNEADDENAEEGQNDTVQTESADEDLSDDQQAALDQIMAEIEGDTAKEPPPEPAPSPEAQEQAESGEELPDDQQDALDKIMAEINGDAPKESPSSDDNLSSPSDSNDESTQVDDQQTTQDDAKAETDADDAKTDAVIESSNVDAPEPTADPDDDNALSEDQQSALDQIMAEIEGDATASDAESTTPSDVADETPTAESNVPSTPAPAEEGSEALDGLSMEEFDDQLSSLLTPTDQTKVTKEEHTAEQPEKEAATPNEQSLADINSALKDIVKESAEDEKPPTDKQGNDTGEDSIAEEPDTPSPVVLEEIKVDPDAKTEKKRSGKRSFSSQWKRALTVSAIIACCAFTAAASYWGYMHLYGTNPTLPENVAPSTATREDSDIIPENRVETAEAVSSQASIPSTVDAPPQSPPKIGFFDGLNADIAAARQQLETKKDEIIELKRYYQNGIQEEQNKLRTVRTKRSVAFKKAIQNRKTELGLRAIQRRMIYNSKLDKPLRDLESALEQLLYLERRARLFELLDGSISGLSLADLKNEGEILIQMVLKQSEALSIDEVKVTSPSLKSIWLGLDQTATITDRAQRNASQLGDQDRQIGEEICSGSYERKYLLSALTAQTATCLTKWPGKDLYLNELEYLSPEVAKQLAQWQGEWLSLNGVKTLSAKTAKRLSQWPGKRLSLNGVTRLSPEATTYLAQWQGDQIEMVGLTAIGRWENYVTRLFLSEELRRKLNMQ